MKTNLIHTRCKSRLIGVERVVTSKPEDPEWPEDVTLLLPWCPECQRLVSIDDTAVTMNTSTN